MRRASLAVLFVLQACAHGAVPATTDRPQLPEIGLSPLPRPIRPAVSTTRQAPTITTIEDLERAVLEGHYAAARDALEHLRGAGGADGTRLACVASELEFAVARYDESIELATLCARSDAEVTRARTRIAEAHLERGRIAAATGVLEALVPRPSAYRARFLLARVHADAGRSRESAELLHRLIDGYNDRSFADDDAVALLQVALAAAELGAIRDANDAFREAGRADPRSTAIQREWARLFLSKRDYGHAGESVRQALAVNPDEPATLALLARLSLENDFDFVAARDAASRAVLLAPDLIEPHLVLGAIALFDLDFAAVSAEIARARATNPDSPEASTLEAALALVRSDEAAFQRAKERTFAAAPGFRGFLAGIAIHAEWEHRYPDLVRLARDALVATPEDGRALAVLGTNLLFLGHEEEGLETLRRSFRRDRYDVQVFNLLKLFEDRLPGHYDVLESAPFSIRLPDRDRVVLERAMPALLAPAYEGMVRRYGFTPEGPVRYELFATTEQFSVRTSGLPNLGVQGVCFGRVITALAPSAMPMDWGQVTWHELAHVFHLQLSQNRVPRWLTEGLAEYETSIARPEWRRELDPVLVAAIDAGTLPPLASMNQAFTHARSGDATLAAYHASSEIATYLVARFGFPKVAELLRGFRTEVRFEVLAPRVFGVSVESIDRDFREGYLRDHAAMRVDARFAFDRYRERGPFEATLAATRTPSARALAEVAAARLIDRDEAGADQAIALALERDADEPLALFLRARRRIEARDPAAIEDLHRVADRAPGSYEARMLLARIAFRSEDEPGAIRELEAAVALDPERPDAIAARLEIGFHDDVAAERAWLARFVAVEEHDADAFARYVAILDAAGDHAEIRPLGERIERLLARDASARLALARAFAGTSPEVARAQLAIAEHLGAPAASLAEVRARIGAR